MAEPTVVAFPHEDRAAPPEHFSPAEQGTWRAVIASRPAGHFGPEIFPVLSSYCTTAMACDEIAARLRVEEGIDHALLERYGELSDSLIDLAEALGILPGAGKRTRDVDD